MNDEKVKGTDVTLKQVGWKLQGLKILASDSEISEEERCYKVVNENYSGRLLQSQEQIRKHQIAELAEKLFVANSSMNVLPYNVLQNMARNAFLDAKIFIEEKEKFLANKEGEE